MLFTTIALPPTSPADALTLKTPLGSMVFSIHANQVLLTPEESRCFSFPDGGLLYQWRNHYFDLELLFCLNPVVVPTGYVLDRCWGVFLRANARESLELIFCGKRSETGGEGFAGGGDTGECLEAMTWDDGKTTVSLGTGDDEFLYQQCGESLPERWRQMLPQNNGTSKFVRPISNRGIEIVPPRLAGGEYCELGFAVAWGGPYDRERPATWFAVDAGHVPQHPAIDVT